MQSEALIPLVLLGLLPKETVNGNEKSMREKYKLIWAPKYHVATLSEESFDWSFADGKKRYLRIATLRHSNKIAHVTLLTVSKIGKPWTQNAIIDASPTHPAGHITTHIYTWTGDVPFLGVVRMVVRENDVGDVIRPCIVYEEQP